MIKAAVASEEVPHHWFDALGLLASCDMDWDYLLRRARSSARCSTRSTARRGERAMSRAADEYLSGRIKEALVADPRVGELDVQVVVSDDNVYVTGDVTTDARRDAITEIAASLAGQRRVCNETTVVPRDEPQTEERLP